LGPGPGIDSSEKRKDGTTVGYPVHVKAQRLRYPNPYYVELMLVEENCELRLDMISTGTSMKIHRKQMVGGQTQNMTTHLPTNHTKYNHEAYLDEAGCDAGAGGGHGLETAVVHHEVTHCNI
jgi:hypothetical protein